MHAWPEGGEKLSYLKRYLGYDLPKINILTCPTLYTKKSIPPNSSIAAFISALEHDEFEDYT